VVIIELEQCAYLIVYRCLEHSLVGILAHEHKQYKMIVVMLSQTTGTNSKILSCFFVWCTRCVWS